MAFQEGDKAPDFTLQSTEGQEITLYKDLANTPCILYFYPKDFTQQCTREACAFRDSFDFFSDLNIKVYGISTDDLETHKKFRDAYNLPFHLLADKDGSVAEKYEARMPLINFTRRVTYLLDHNHNIKAIYQNLFAGKKHIEKMIASLNNQ